MRLPKPAAVATFAIGRLVALRRSPEEAGIRASGVFERRMKKGANVSFKSF
jgi:hypothetical protein